MTAPGFEDLPGTKLPVGEFTILEEEQKLTLEIIGGTDSGPGVAHPLWAYIAPQRGIGITVDEICKLANFDMSDGPMLGSSHLEYRDKLRIGVSYEVTGEVIGIERKHGGSGTFDVLEFREELREPGGEMVCASTSTYILPRRGL